MMRGARLLVLVLLSFTVAPSTDAIEEPIPRVDVGFKGPMADHWTTKSAHIPAIAVRLNALGTHTHANWILFRLPFDTTDLKRVRIKTWHVTARVPSEVGALRLGSLCIAVAPSGGADDWARYTASGIRGSLPFRWHPYPPTVDPSILAINAPTRVANFVACGWDGGVLRDPDSWALDIDWDER